MQQDPVADTKGTAPKSAIATTQDLVLSIILSTYLVLWLVLELLVLRLRSIGLVRPLDKKVKSKKCKDTRTKG